MLKHTTTKSFGEKGEGEGQFKSPSGLAINSQKEIFVTDEFNHRIQKFSPDGTFIKSFGSFGKESSCFHYPTGIATDKEDNIVVTDRWNHRVQKFSSDGIFLNAFGSYGNRKGLFSEPSGIAVTSDNEIFVSDLNNHRVQKFSSDGIFLDAFGCGGPNQHFYESTEFKANFTYKKWLQQQNKFNTIETIFKNEHYPMGLLEYPGHLSLDDSQTLWLCDTGNNRVLNFSPAGRLLAAYGPLEKFSCAFSTPTASFLRNNILFVSCFFNSTIHRIDLSSKEEKTLDLKNISPASIYVSDENEIWICDQKKNQITQIRI